MIISHRKKFAFFANQKTGSKAVGIALRMAGVFDENDILTMQPFLSTRTANIELPAYNLNGHKTYLVDHMCPQQAIDAGFITLEQLREYDCYAYLRKPEERYLAARVCIQINRHGVVAKPRTPNNSRKRFNGNMSGECPPQHTFFYVGDEQVVTPLDFDDYEGGLRLMIDKLGGINHMNLPAVTRSNKARFVAGREEKYDPKQHIKDEELYGIMKHANKD